MTSSSYKNLKFNCKSLQLKKLNQISIKRKLVKKKFKLVDPCVKIALINRELKGSQSSKYSLTFSERLKFSEIQSCQVLLVIKNFIKVLVILIEAPTLTVLFLSIKNTQQYFFFLHRFLARKSGLGKRVFTLPVGFFLFQI